MAPVETLLAHGKPPIVIAHRGASATAPENTMTAFRVAWGDGCSWVETDVQPSADDALVLIHDDDVDRTTNGTGPVRNHSAAEMAELDAGLWFGEAFTDTRIPTLRQLVAEVSGERRLLLEIKGPHTDEHLRQILDELDRTAALPRTVLQSFQIPLLTELRRMLPDEPLGLLVEIIDDDPVAECAKLGAVTYNPDVRELLNHQYIVADLHQADIAVIPWTANTPEQWATLTSIGVDGMFTDVPAELLSWLADRYPQGA